MITRNRLGYMLRLVGVCSVCVCVCLYVRGCNTHVPELLFCSFGAVCLTPDTRCEQKAANVFT